MTRFIKKLSGFISQKFFKKGKNRKKIDILYAPYLSPLPRHLSLLSVAPLSPCPAHKENEERKSMAACFT
jgi:hypothetical protein